MESYNLKILGYKDNFCSVCQDKYFRQGVVCRSCEDPAFNLDAVMGVASIFASIVSISVIGNHGSVFFFCTLNIPSFFTGVTLFNIQPCLQPTCLRPQLSF